MAKTPKTVKPEEPAEVSEKTEVVEKAEKVAETVINRFLSIKDNGNEFVNEDNTIFLLPYPHAGMKFSFLMFNEGVELCLSGNGLTNIFSNKGMTDEYKLSGVPKNLAAYITVIGCGEHWRIHPNFF